MNLLKLVMKYLYLMAQKQEHIYHQRDYKI